MLQTLTEEKNHEDEAARNLIAGMETMPGVTFTFDALHTRDETTKLLVEEKQADYFTVVKLNTANLHNKVKELVKNNDTLNAESYDQAHGRREHRSVQICHVLPEDTGYPYCHICGKIVRKRQKIKNKTIVASSLEEEYFVASHKDIKLATPEFFLNTARKHWSIENKLHHVKDRSMDEDRINARGGYARIMSALRSLVALTLNNLKDSLNCIQRRISSNKRCLIAMLNCKSLSKWALAFL